MSLGTPSVQTLINSSNTILLGNTTSTALTVQQLGGGDVVTFSNSSGVACMNINSTGQSVASGQVQSLDSLRGHSLPSDAMIFASATQVNPVNQNPGSYAIVESSGGVSGNPSISVVAAVTQSPFADLYKEGSMYFPGVNTSNISVGLGSSYNFQFGLTAEAWVYYTSFAGNVGTSGTTPVDVPRPCMLGAFQPSVPNSMAWSLGADTNGKLTFYYYGYTGPTNQSANTNISLSLNTWNHIAVSIPSGGPGSLYINGVQQTSNTNVNGSVAAASASTFALNGTPFASYNYLGVGSFIAAFTTGYIADARVVYGAALYTGSSFTVPSAPLSPSATGSNALLLRAGQNSPTIQSGALTFDRGLKQYIEFGPQTFNLASQGFTAMFRWKNTGTATSYERIFEFGNGYVNTTTCSSIVVWRDSQGLFFYIYPPGSAGGYSTYLNSGFLQNITYVVACRYDPSTQLMSMWLNGNPVGTPTTLTLANAADRTLATVRIGGDCTGPNASYGPQQVRCLTGTMNTFAVYNRALSNAEILTATNALNTVPATPLQKTIEIGDINSTPALSVAGNGQVSVGAIGLTSNVLPWPPSAMTGYDTLINGGVYKARDSSEFNTTLFGAWQAFDKTNANQWSSGQPLYSTSAPYSYTGTVTTTDVNGTVYPGEWVQIQLPTSVVLSSYSIYGVNGSNQMPGKWVVLGSRDGVNWTLVDSRSTNILYTAASGYSSFTVSSTQAFTYYRITTNQISGNSTYQCVTVVEWTLYGTADTSPALTIAPATTFVNSVATPALSGIAGNSLVPQDFSSSALNIPAYVVSNTATVANTVQYTNFGPFAGEGSLYFGGGGSQRISFGVQPQFAYNWTSYDFTMECFLYHTSRPYDARLLSRDNDILMYIQGPASTSPNSLTLYSAGITSPTGGSFTGGTVSLNQWNHLAVSYIASTSTFYLAVNGTVTAVPKVTGTFQYTGTNNTNIDYWFGQTGTNIGYLASFRFTRGLALYTTNFTPPTQSLQPIQGVTQAGLPYGTVLLLRNAPAPGRIQTTKFSGANSVGLGGAAQVLAFPPAAMTTYATALSSGYGQGTYVASASSEFDYTTNASWRVFDKSTSGYSSGFNTYVSGVQGGYYTTVDVNGTVYQGDWVQIQMPTSIVLSNYSLAGVSTGYLPNKFWILGSRDGTNWNLVDSRTGVTNWPSTAGYLNFTAYTSSAFSYFRIVMFSVQNSGAYAQLGEMVLNGSIEGLSVTADGRLGIGSSAPTRSLEVAGDAIVAGTVSSGNPITFKNRFINGNFNVWQRGTSFTATANVYTADRWVTPTNSPTVTATQVNTVPFRAGFQYAISLATASGGSPALLEQRIEQINTYDLYQGTPITISFWARQTVGTPGVLNIEPLFPPSINAFGSGLADACTPTVQQVQLSTNWQYYALTFCIATTSVATNGLDVQWWQPSAQNPATIQLTGVQLEKGTVATPFEVRPYGVELQLCQRYYYQVSGGGNYAVLGTGFAISATAVIGTVPIPPMRASPSTFYCSQGSASYPNGTITQGTTASNNDIYGYFAGSNYNFTTVSASSSALVPPGTYAATIQLSGGAGGLTAGWAGSLVIPSTAGKYWAISAEL